MPSDERLHAKSTIELVVARPPGVKDIPDATITKAQLLAEGWTLQNVGCPDQHHRVLNVGAGLRSYRHQYRLQPCWFYTTFYNGTHPRLSDH